MTDREKMKDQTAEVVSGGAGQGNPAATKVGSLAVDILAGQGKAGKAFVEGMSKAGITQKTIEKAMGTNKIGCDKLAAGEDAESGVAEGARVVGGAD